MRRAILSAAFGAVLCAFLAGCGTIDRCIKGLQDPDTGEITHRQHQ